MINPNPYYPYQQNVQILKGFFSKPLTLICAIASGLTGLLGMLSINTSAGSTSVSFSNGTGGSISILLCIALIFLYVKCRSNDPMPFGAMVTLIKVYAIIEIVVGGLALLAFTGITFMVALVLQEIFTYILIFCIFVIPLALVTLLHGIGLLLWASSVKRGATSVYLSSRGSILLAVSSILFIIVSIATTIASFIFIKEYGPEISAYLHRLAAENPNFHYNSVFDSTSPMSSLIISAAKVVTVISMVLSTAFYALLAALAISFHIYIKKHTNGINFGAGQTPEYNAQPNAVPVPPVAPVTDEMPSDNNQPPVQQPIDFQPQSVDFGSMNTVSDSEPNNTAQFENPYMQAVADDMSDKPESIVCPNCHMQCGANMKFCGNCGAKLK